MKGKDDIVFYSANTKLAYWINENFYGKHFVWCSPVFDAESLDKLDIYKNIPQSSNPHAIYKRLKQDVDGSDLHSNNILQNRSGLKKGAIKMLNDGVVDDTEFGRINLMIDNATIDKFHPLIYVIPKLKVETKLKIVNVELTANPLGIEYQIADLILNEFSVINF